MANVRTFLMEHGLIAPHEVPTGSGEFRIICPKCENDAKKCYVNANGNGVLCFHCDLRSSWRAFQRRYEPPTPEETALEDFVSRCEEALHLNQNILAYLRERGFTDETIRSQRLGFCDGQGTPTDVDRKLGLAQGEEWYLEGRITIPYIVDGLVVKVRGRCRPDSPSRQKYLDCPGAQPQPYFPASLVQEYPVVVVEGEFDAILLRQKGIQSIGVPGANAANPSWLFSIRHLYLCFDGDDAGRKGLATLTKGLTEFRRIEMPDGFDVSDYVTAFGVDSFKLLMQKAVLYLHGHPQKEDSFPSLVEDFTGWAWSNGTLMGPKISWAPRLESLLAGWQAGFILLGARAHVGKSSFMVKCAYELVQEDPDAICVMLSLDDTARETMQRLISLHSQIDFRQVRTPRWSFDHPTDPTRQRPDLLARYNASLESLKSINNLIVRDATYGRSLKYLKAFFASLRAKYPEKRIVVFIDSLAKVTADGADDDDVGGLTVRLTWKAYLASELKYLSTAHDITIVTPADLRKQNGIIRPGEDDLKDCAELAYEAQVILMGYSDIRHNAETPLSWVDPDGNLQPIVEWNCIKNKFTGKTGTIRYRFWGDYSDFNELSESEDNELTERVRIAQASQGRAA